MKKPSIDRFIQTEGSVFVENTETGEEIVFFQNEASNLAIRSMLEDDLQVVAKIAGMNKREKKDLLKKLKEDGSEEKFFVLVETFQTDAKGDLRIIGAAKAKGVDLDIVIRFDNNLTPNIFEFAKNVILARIRLLIDDFYCALAIDGKVTIHRAA